MSYTPPKIVYNYVLLVHCSLYVWCILCDLLCFMLFLKWYINHVLFNLYKIYRVLEAAILCALCMVYRAHCSYYSMMILCLVLSLSKLCIKSLRTAMLQCPASINKDIDQTDLHRSEPNSIALLYDEQPHYLH